MPIAGCSATCPLIARFVTEKAASSGGEAVVRLNYGISPPHSLDEPEKVAEALRVMSRSRTDPAGWLAAVQWHLGRTLVP